MYSIDHRFIQQIVVFVSTMMEQPQSTELRRLPTDIDSSQGKLVYLSLEATGGATADELADLLSMQKISILSVLNSLSSRDLVEKRDGTYVTSA